MPPTITLQVVQGTAETPRLEVDERTVCMVGRSRECSLRVPSDDAHKGISRFHCLLDINPPDVRIRDFGSLNGTWSTQKIG